MASEKYEILETWTSKVIVVTTVQCCLACLVAVTFPIGAIFPPVFSNTWLVLSKATQSCLLTTSFALGHQCYQHSEVEKHPRAPGAARWHDNEQPEYVAPLIWGSHACNWLLSCAIYPACFRWQFAQSEVLFFVFLASWHLRWVKLITKSLEYTHVFTNCSKVRGLVNLKVMIYMPFQTGMTDFLLILKNVYWSFYAVTFQISKIMASINDKDCR